DQAKVRILFFDLLEFSRIQTTAIEPALFQGGKIAVQALFPENRPLLPNRNRYTPDGCSSVWQEGVWLYRGTSRPSFPSQGSLQPLKTSSDRKSLASCLLSV